MTVITTEKTGMKECTASVPVAEGSATNTPSGMYERRRLLQNHRQSIIHIY